MYTMTTMAIEEARAYYQSVCDLPLPVELPLSRDWVGYRERHRNAIEGFCTVSDAVHFAQRHHDSGFNHRFAVGGDMSNIDDKLRLFEEECPGFLGRHPTLEDSRLSIPETVRIINGRYYSNIFFWHLHAYAAILRYLCAEPRSILEIGGGLGELARMFKLAHPEMTYTILDLPESLFFAYAYLRAHFPDAVISGGDRLPTGADFVLVPVQYYSVLYGSGPYDVAVSQGSMQEMPPETSKFYMRLVHDVGVRSFYSLNYHSLEFAFPEGWRKVHERRNVPIIVWDSLVDMETCWGRET